MKSTRKKTGSTAWCLLLLFLWPLAVVGCNDEKNTIHEVPNDWVVNLPESIEFDVMGGDKELSFTFDPNVNAEHVACILSEENKEWCSAKITSNTLKIKVSPSGFSRSAAITLIYDKDHKFVTYVNQKSDYSAFFTDESCSQLKQGITESKIAEIPNKEMRQVALALLEGTYDREFRIADYRPYQHPSVMAGKNKTSKYSLRDNPTGIYADKNDVLFIYLGEVYEGAKISMLIQDLSEGYNNNKTIALNEGLNRVVAPIKGLIYILNHVEENIPLLLKSEEDIKTAAAKTVKAHFLFGKVNGYYDVRKHSTQEEWVEMLSKAPYQDIDVLGMYSHITWNVEQFKGNNVQSNKGVTTDINRMIDQYDRLVYLQQDFMGLVKYNRMFNNRMHFSVDYTAVSPNASDYRTVYNYSQSYAEPFCNPDKFAGRCWGPAHEVGHCNQTRPGMKWAGTTEVTNNIMSLHIQTSFGETCKLIKDQITPKDEKGNSLKKDIIYPAASALIIDGNRAHCLPGITDIVRETQLVPFWQLKLYMIDALGKADLYKDLYEYFRENSSPSDTGKNAGLDQLDFVRQVCRISGLNMLDFFEKWGFLKPVNTILNDYGNKTFIVTQYQVDELKKEINDRNYAQPAQNVHQITDANWETYKH